MSTSSGMRPNNSKPASGPTNTRPPVKLTFEEKIPLARWIVVGGLSLLVCGILAFWINSGNPDIDAAGMAAITPVAIATPTLLANAGGYSAVVEFRPPEPVPADSIMTFTTTLYLDGKPAPGARMILTLYNPDRAQSIDLAEEITGIDGSAVTSYNVQIFKQHTITATASFYDGNKLLTRAKARFTPQ